MNQGWETISRKPFSSASRSGTPAPLAEVVFEEKGDRLGLDAGAGRRYGRPHGVHSAGPRTVLVNGATLRPDERTGPGRTVLHAQQHDGEPEVLGDRVQTGPLEKLGRRDAATPGEAQHVERREHDVDVGAAAIEARDVRMAGERELLVLAELPSVAQDLGDAGSGVRRGLRPHQADSLTVISASRMRLRKAWGDQTARGMARPVAGSMRKR
jgi:hypothetical protein